MPQGNQPGTYLSSSCRLKSCPQLLRLPGLRPSEGRKKRMRQGPGLWPRRFVPRKHKSGKAPPPPTFSVLLWLFPKRETRIPLRELSVGFCNRRWDFVAKALKLHPREAHSRPAPSQQWAAKRARPEGEDQRGLPRPRPVPSFCRFPRQSRGLFTLTLAKFSPPKLRQRGLSRVQSRPAFCFLSAYNGN